MYSMANVKLQITKPGGTEIAYKYMSNSVIEVNQVNQVNPLNQDEDGTDANYFKLYVIDPKDWDTFTVNYGNNIPPIKQENISTTYKKYKLIPFKGRPHQVVPANITFSNQNVQIATLLFAEDGVNVTLTAQPTLGYTMSIILNPNAQSKCSSGSTPSLLSFDKTQIQNFGVCLSPVLWLQVTYDSSVFDSMSTSSIGTFSSNLTVTTITVATPTTGTFRGFKNTGGDVFDMTVDEAGNVNVLRNGGFNVICNGVIVDNPSFTFNPGSTINFSLKNLTFVGTRFQRITKVVDCAFINNGNWGQSGNICGIIYDMGTTNNNGIMTFPTSDIPIGAKVRNNYWSNDENYPVNLDGTVVTGYTSKIYPTFYGGNNGGNNGSSSLGVQPQSPTNATTDALIYALCGTTPYMVVNNNNVWSQGAYVNAYYGATLLTNGGGDTYTGYVQGNYTTSIEYDITEESDTGIYDTNYENFLTVSQSFAMDEPISMEFVWWLPNGAITKPYGDLRLVQMDNPGITLGSFLLNSTISLSDGTNVYIQTYDDVEAGNGIYWYQIRIAEISEDLLDAIQAVYDNFTGLNINLNTLNYAPWFTLDSRIPNNTDTYYDISNLVTYIQKGDLQLFNTRSSSFDYNSWVLTCDQQAQSAYNFYFKSNLPAGTPLNQIAQITYDIDLAGSYDKGLYFNIDKTYGAITFTWLNTLTGNLNTLQTALTALTSAYPQIFPSFLS